MNTCEFCRYSTIDDDEFKRHKNRAACRESRHYLFCCKRCDTIEHTFKALKIHNCKRLYFERNEMERLRTIESQMQPLVTLDTLAYREWHKMVNQLKLVQSRVPNATLKTIHLKEVQRKCKENGISPYILESLVQYNRWLNEFSPDLLNINYKYILELKNFPYYTYYFEFTIYRDVDILHYFRLLFAKCEAGFWPFLITNDEIVNKIFHCRFCPIFYKDSKYYARKTRDELKSEVLELPYKNWYWALVKEIDLVRLINNEWTLVHFKRIIVILEQVPILLQANDSSTEQKLNKLFPNLLNFICYWNNPNRFLKDIRNETSIQTSNEEFQYVNQFIDFEHAVKIYAKKKQLWNSLVNVINTLSRN